MARKARDDAAFATAVSTGTAAGYRTYLVNCAADGCLHRGEAEQAWASRVRGERDAAAFAGARGADSEAAYRQYLNTCCENGCAYRAEAGQRLAAIEQRRREEEARQAEQRRREEEAQQAEQRRQQAPVDKVRAYFDHAAAGRIDAAIACLDNPKPSSRNVLKNLASANVNELRLESIGSNRAQVFLDWTGTTRDGKNERYGGLVPMVLRDGDWRIESFGQLQKQ